MAEIGLQGLTYIFVIAYFLIGLGSAMTFLAFDRAEGGGYSFEGIVSAVLALIAWPFSLGYLVRLGEENIDDDV